MRRNFFLTELISYKEVESYEQFGDTVDENFPLLDPDIKDHFNAHVTWFQDRIGRSTSSYKEVWETKHWWMEKPEMDIKKLEMTKVAPLK